MNQYRLFLLTLLLGILIFAGFSCRKPVHSESCAHHPEWSRNASIYEVNLRQYTPEGTIQAFLPHLPRLKELGVDILWLMPIHPIGELNRKGTLGSYYSVRDYTGLNPEFGTPEDFQMLVQRIHDFDMKIIIDWVANHTAWDHQWTETHPEFYTRDDAGNFVPPMEDWSDVIDLDYGSRQLWDEMISALKFWVEEFDIDGYRCDVAALVPTAFWEQARTELDKIKPVFMLAEAHEPELHNHAFDMTYGWQFKDSMNKIAAGDQNANDLFEEIQKEKSEYHPNAYRMLFTTNHDENSWNGTAPERLGDGLELFTVLSTILPGMPLIYSGQEAGLSKALSFFEKDEIEWKQDPMADVISRHLKLKRGNQALWNGAAGGDIVRLHTSHDQEILVVSRSKNTHHVLAVFNLSPETVRFSFRNDADLLPDMSRYSGSFTLDTSEETWAIGPWEYAVYDSR